MRRVLIVDDELSVCRMIQKTLESTEKYRASFCTTREETVQLAKHFRPEVILLDVTMPGLSGPEIVEQLRGDPATKDIPFIYVTGMPVKEEVKNGARFVGDNFFVTKPVQEAELLRVLDMVLGKEK